MLPYIEILDKNSRQVTYIIEPNEVWLEQCYYTVGEFEVYTRATEEALAALVVGNYVKIPNKPYLWLIEAVEYSFSTDKGRMISATGREAKAILEKRIIANTNTLSTDLIASVNKLVMLHAGSNALPSRQIKGLTVAESSVVQTADTTQVSYENLLSFTDEVLKAYGIGAKLTIDGTNLVYTIYRGEDKHESIIFSQSYDNLLSCSYKKDVTNKKSVAYIGGTGEGKDRVISTYNADTSSAYIDRAEIFIDAKDIATKYDDENGTQQELDLTNSADLEIYEGWLEERGKEKLAEYIPTEAFSGEIDTNNSLYEYGVDYGLGDIVRVQDEYFDFYTDARIIKHTISQNTERYSENIEYEN